MGDQTDSQTGTLTVKRGLAQMLKGGVIMDVVTPEQAVVAQEAGAVAVMALERIPADIRAMGGVARMSNVELVQSIMDAVTIPVMAKVRIGHFAEAQALQRRHLDFYLAQAGAVWRSGALGGSEDQVQALTEELPNVRAALAYA
ncbi:MAG: hypothetical protein ABR508_01500, partial [Candidatus Baltobacteraceae bacterium]